MLFEISASTSVGLEGIIVIRDLTKLFTSVSGAHDRVKRCSVLLEGLESSLIILIQMLLFCKHFTCWPQDTSSFLSDPHHSTNQSCWSSRRETGVTLRLAYFPIVIWASLVKNSTFILVSRSSLLWRILSSLEGFCFLHSLSSLNKTARDCECEVALDAT